MMKTYKTFENFLLEVFSNKNFFKNFDKNEGLRIETSHY